MPHVLVTGFDRFGLHVANSSQLVVEALAKRRASGVSFEVLPVTFQGAGERVEARIRSQRLDALVMLGMAAGSFALRLERQARNRDASAARDNAGQCRQGPIVVDGPDVYSSTLPLERFAEAVRALGAPIEFSEDAGGFVCNHVYYRARHCIQTENPRIRCGFLHVPVIEPGQLELWVDALEACLRALGVCAG